MLPKSEPVNIPFLRKAYSAERYSLGTLCDNAPPLPSSAVDIIDLFSMIDKALMRWAYSASVTANLVYFVMQIFHLRHRRVVLFLHEHQLRDKPSCRLAV